jgi:hypothetical protein
LLLAKEPAQLPRRKRDSSHPGAFAQKLSMAGELFLESLPKTANLQRGLAAIHALPYLEKKPTEEKR